MKEELVIKILEELTSEELLYAILDKLPSRKAEIILKEIMDENEIYEDDEIDFSPDWDEWDDN